MLQILQLIAFGFINRKKQQDQAMKMMNELKKGDKIDFVAPYYSYDGELDDEFYINDTLVVGDKPLTVSYESLGDGECLIYYKLTDIFGNVYYTEPVIVY